MSSLQQLIRDVGSVGQPPGMLGVANRLGVAPPVSLRKMMSARAFSVSFRSYTVPKFWDDPGVGDINSYDLEMLLTQDRKVGDRHWSRGCSYSVLMALNTIWMSKNEWEQAKEEFETLWNAFVQGYEQAKDAVVDVVADAVDEVVSCGAPCRGYLKTALEAGLTAVGIPPRLPTTSQLVAMGADYLAAQVVDAALPGLYGGISDLAGPEAKAYLATVQPQVREEAHQRLKAEMEARGREMLLPPPPAPDERDPRTWGVPNPLYRARPGVLYVNIAPKPGSEPSLAHGTWTLSPAEVFSPVTFSVKYLPPQGMVIPVVLWPPMGRAAQAVRADDLRQYGDFDGWFDANFGGFAYDANSGTEARIGTPQYARLTHVNFSVLNPDKLLVYSSKVSIAGEHNISPRTDVNAPVYGGLPVVSSCNG